MKADGVLKSLMSSDVFPSDIWLHAFYTYLSHNQNALAFTILNNEKIRQGLKKSSPDLESKMDSLFQAIFFARSQHTKKALLELDLNHDFIKLKGRIYKSLAPPSLRRGNNLEVQNSVTKPRNTIIPVRGPPPRHQLRLSRPQYPSIRV
jgi:hypothetical protein